jgi:hypothetical protein
MAKPTYTVKVLKVDATAIDLELKAAADPYVYCWPSLPVRALADGPGSPLSTFDLSTREGVGIAAAAWVAQVEILATRRGIGLGGGLWSRGAPRGHQEGARRHQGLAESCGDSRGGSAERPHPELVSAPGVHLG